jgi:hypothetical protein
MRLTSEIVKDTGAARRFRLLAPLAALLLVLAPLMLVPAMIGNWVSFGVPPVTWARHRQPGAGQCPMTAEHSIAPLAVDILPFVDETNLRYLATVSYRCFGRSVVPRELAWSLRASPALGS